MPLLKPTTLLVLLLSAHTAYSQSPPAPWTGVLGRESNDSNLPWNVQHRTFKDAISDDGGAPSGSVTFRESNTVLGTAPIANGVATLTASFRKGTHQLTASWSGDANFVGSSGSATHRVN